MSLSPIRALTLEVPESIDLRQAARYLGAPGEPGSGTLAAYLSGEIDHHAAQSIRREIDAQVDDRLPELLTLDFSGVTFMDSSGVGLILGRGRHISARCPAWVGGLLCKTHRIPCAACWTWPA